MSLPLTNMNPLQGKAYVNGEWIDADSGKTLPVNNPAIGEIAVALLMCIEGGLTL